MIVVSKNDNKFYKLQEVSVDDIIEGISGIEPGDFLVLDYWSDEIISFCKKNYWKYNYMTIPDSDILLSK